MVAISLMSTKWGKWNIAVVLRDVDGVVVAASCCQLLASPFIITF